MTTYRGLCIGGPLHSKELAHTTNVYAVLLVPTMALAKPPKSADALFAGACHTGHYIFNADDNTWVWQG